ncbi:MAG: TolC family protein [Candidatus Aminicenantes bacterium]|nr:TolC family protein [Candidatus Aminicenantes bacterium]
MRKRAISISILILSILFYLCFPSYGEEGEVFSLSLEECVLKALKNNLRVAVESYNPEIADIAVTQAREFFLPRIDLDFSRQETKNPPYWWIQGADTIASERDDYGVTLNQQIPTGGSFSLSLTSYRTDTNEAFRLINPLYSSTLSFGFTQPILKNFGFRVSRKEIIIASNNRDISRNQLKSTLFETIYSVQEAYWNLVYSIENFKVKQQSLQLARDLLAKNKKEVEVGKLAPIEVLNAQAVVASREADILQAESLIKSNEDLLKTIINLSEEKGLELAKIVPVDKPEFIEREISLEEALKEALAKRPDLEMTKFDIETKQLNLSVARNQMLPELNLQVSYWSPGLSGDRLLYLDDNFLSGEVIGTEKGSATDSLKDALGLLYNNWTIGLTLSLPLSSFTTRAALARSKVELSQSLTRLKDLEQQISLEVRNAVRDIETNAKTVQAYRLAREFATERLQAEEKKLNVGLTTNYFVLQYQEELARQRSMELKAIVDYSLAWARLEKAMGTSLEKRNIKLSEFH